MQVFELVCILRIIVCISIYTSIFSVKQQMHYIFLLTHNTLVEVLVIQKVLDIAYYDPKVVIVQVRHYEQQPLLRRHPYQDSSRVHNLFGLDH